MAMAPNFIANGTINPSTFVKMDTTSGKNFYVIASSAAADTSIGISQPGTFDAPGVNGAGSDAADAGEPLQVYGIGEVCLLKMGSGGCTAGDRLQSDASGQGVTATISGTSAVYYSAIALETASSGDLARVIFVGTQAITAT